MTANPPDFIQNVTLATLLILSIQDLITQKISLPFLFTAAVLIIIQKLSAPTTALQPSPAEFAGLIAKTIIIPVVLYTINKTANHFTNHKSLATGDQLFIIFLSLNQTQPQTFISIFIAALLAELYIILISAFATNQLPKVSKLPFIPFLSISYILTNQIIQ